MTSQVVGMTLEGAGHVVLGVQGSQLRVWSCLGEPVRLQGASGHGHMDWEVLQQVGPSGVHGEAWHGGFWLGTGLLLLSFDSGHVQWVSGSSG